MKQGWILVENNGTQENLAPKTMADMVYVDNTLSMTVQDALNEVMERTVATETILIPAVGWVYEEEYERYVLTMPSAYAQAAYKPEMIIDPDVAGPKIPVYGIRCEDGAITLFAQQEVVIEGDATIIYRAVS